MRWLHRLLHNCHEILAYLAQLHFSAQGLAESSKSMLIVNRLYSFLALIPSLGGSLGRLIVSSRHGGKATRSRPGTHEARKPDLPALLAQATPQGPHAALPCRWLPGSASCCGS